jgi:hypothetical protein
MGFEDESGRFGQRAGRGVEGGGGCLHG